MAGNRVEELEAKVRELEATVAGLTDELVETKERLHVLEDEADVEPDIIEGRVTRRDAQDETTSGADEEEASAEDVTTDEADGEDNADSAGDDIIVA